MLFHLQLSPELCDTAAASAAQFPRMEAEGAVAVEMVTAADETCPAGSCRMRAAEGCGQGPGALLGSHRRPALGEGPEAMAGTRAGQGHQPGLALHSCLLLASQEAVPPTTHQPGRTAAPTSMDPGQPVLPAMHPWPGLVTPLPHCAAGLECCNCSHLAKAA